MPVCGECLAVPCVCVPLKAPSFAFHFNLDAPFNGPLNAIDIPEKLAAAVNDARVYDATFEAPILRIGPDDLVLDTIIAWGTYGVVISTQDKKYVVKFQRGNEEEYHLEIATSALASRLKAGPMFLGWGIVNFDSDANFKALAALPQSTEYAKLFNRQPAWLSASNVTKLVFMVSEAWDASLLTFLSENQKEFRHLTNPTVVQPGVLEKFIGSVQKLHEHDVLHLDMLPKNILVRFSQGRISAMCLTDYGSSVSTYTWFFNTATTSRETFERYHTKTVINSGLAHVADQYYGPYMMQIFRLQQRTDAAALAAWQRWLRDSPVNFDNALLFYLASWKMELWPLINQTKESAYLMPNEFNWTYDPKSLDGSVETYVDVEGRTVIVTLNWLDTVSEIRYKIDDKVEGTLKRMQFYTALGAVTEMDEHLLQYSNVTTTDAQNRMRLKLTAIAKPRFNLFSRPTLDLYADEDI